MAEYNAAPSSVQKLGTAPDGVSMTMSFVVVVVVNVSL
jgi:hypothetical protein